MLGMGTVTFDTYELINKLKSVGFEEKQAEALVRVVAEAQGELVTKKEYLERQLSPIRMDLTLMKWMLGLLLAGVLALVLKAFF